MKFKSLGFLILVFFLGLLHNTTHVNAAELKNECKIGGSIDLVKKVKCKKGSGNIYVDKATIAQGPGGFICSSPPIKSAVENAQAGVGCTRTSSSCRYGRTYIIEVKKAIDRKGSKKITCNVCLSNKKDSSDLNKGIKRCISEKSKSGKKVKVAKAEQAKPPKKETPKKDSKLKSEKDKRKDGGKADAEKSTPPKADPKKTDTKKVSTKKTEAKAEVAKDTKEVKKAKAEAIKAVSADRRTSEISPHKKSTVIKRKKAIAEYRAKAKKAAKTAAKYVKSGVIKKAEAKRIIKSAMSQPQKVVHKPVALSLPDASGVGAKPITIKRNSTYRPPSRAVARELNNYGNLTNSGTGNHQSGDGSGQAGVYAGNNSGSYSGGYGGGYSGGGGESRRASASGSGGSGGFGGVFGSIGKMVGQMIGKSQQRQAKQKQPPKPSCRMFMASNNTIRPGESTILKYVMVYADYAEISGIGSVEPRAGSIKVSPIKSTDYMLQAQNRYGFGKCPVVHITVDANNMTEQDDSTFGDNTAVSCSPESVSGGGSAIVLWQCPPNTVKSIGSSTEYGGFTTSGKPEGSLMVTPRETSKFVVRCRNKLGIEVGRSSCRVNIGTAYNAANTGANTNAENSNNTTRVNAQLTVNKTEVNSGDTVTISWSGHNTTSCAITGPDGFKEHGNKGSVTGRMLQTSTFKLNCSAGDTKIPTKSITITVK